MMRPWSERIFELARILVGRHIHVRWIENCGDRFLPEIAMVGKVEIEEAECRHQRGMMRRDKVPIVAEVRVAGRKMFSVVVSSCCGGAVRIVDQWPLKFIGYNAK